MKWEVRKGDAVEQMATLPDCSIDLTVTSPPYDNLRTYEGFTFDFEGTARELFRVTKQGGVVVWVVGDETKNGSETGTSFRQALYFKDECGFNLHDTMIYKKIGSIPLNHNRYEQEFEFMFVLSKGKPEVFSPLTIPTLHGGQKNTMTHRRTSDGLTTASGYGQPVKTTKFKGNVWAYTIGKGNTTLDDYAFQHPATFPEALAYDHILSWSNEGDTVLDPMCGSGTTGKMAVIAKRNFIGIEISEKYCAIARARIKRASGEWAEIPRREKPDEPLPLFDREALTA